MSRHNIETPYDISVSTLCFYLFVNWEEADVDIALTESGSPFQPDRKVQSRTPTSGSVEYFHEMAFRDKILKKKGVSLAATYGFMQGCARLDFEVELTDFPTLWEQIEFTKKRVAQLLDECIEYYEEGETVRRSIVLGAG